jgi:hypothetical protein
VVLQGESTNARVWSRRRLRASKYNREEKRSEAPAKNRERLCYCINVNRTSLDHLLLGVDADIDKVSHEPSIHRMAVGRGPTLENRIQKHKLPR